MVWTVRRGVLSSAQGLVEDRRVDGGCNVPRGGGGGGGWLSAGRLVVATVSVGIAVNLPYELL